MGWGTKKGAAPQPRSLMRLEVGAPARAKPEPLPALDYEGPDLSEEAAATLNARYAPDTLQQKPTAAAKAQLEWHQLKSKKGWTEATLLLLLYEFIQSRALFADLVTFAKRRK